MVAIVEHTTVLKTEINSHKNGVWFVEKSELPEIAKGYIDRDQHSIITLKNPLTLPDGSKGKEFYCYNPHIPGILKIASQKQIEKATPMSAPGSPIVKIKTKWRAQNDNSASIGDQGPGWRHCNTTSHTVLLGALWGDDYLEAWGKQAGFNQPEERLLSIVDKYGDTTDHVAIEQALAELGVESYWTTSLSFKDVSRSIDLGIPVPIGTMYKSGGHIVCMAGRNMETGAFYIMDSYGIRAGASDNWVTIFDGGSGYEGGGAYDEWSADILQKLWLDVGNQESGWGRIVTAYKDKNGKRIETGLSKGL